MDELSLHGGIVFDEMKLSEHVSVKSSGALEGFVDLGSFTPGDQKTTTCDHGLVVMFQPFHGDWTQVLGTFAPRSNVKAGTLSKILLEATLLAEQAGLFVDFVTCDGASWNRSMWKSFGMKASAKEICCKVHHPVDRRRSLHFLSDFPHLIKCIRNTVVSTGVQTPDGHVRIEHVEEAWKCDKANVFFVVVTIALLGTGNEATAARYFPVASTTTTTGWHVSTDTSVIGLPVITECKLPLGKPLDNGALPVFEEPCDHTGGYIGARNNRFVGFGAGTLADMQLMLLLLMQVFFVLGTSVLLGVGNDATSAPYFPDASTTTTTGWHVSTGTSEIGLLIIPDCKLPFDEPYGDGALPVFEEPCDHNGGARQNGFVGFGAGTLADMQLMSVLLMQVFFVLGTTALLGVGKEATAALHFPDAPTTTTTGWHVSTDTSVFGLPVITECKLPLNKPFNDGACRSSRNHVTTPEAI
ncbi:uncharacterized protein ISCGN_023925 [Ixodes scapularis]